MSRLSVAQARRIAIAAQGLAAPRPSGRVDVRHLRKVFDHVGTIQLDSVNVIARTHYLAVFSRLGPYPMDLIDDYAWKSGEIYEFWGHMASLLPIDTYPVFGFRRDRRKMWSRVEEMIEEHPEDMEAVLEEVRLHGPISVGELSDPGSRTGPWWGYGKGKIALEWLFATGAITAVRDHRFTRYYADPAAVIDTEHFSRPELDPEESYRYLLEAGARSVGVG
ncbi:MAG: winged helix-turn-helix domain-containing protein, partial [Acidimicrobiia bacterium]|nr:winged helix-turn-helix domain-containing protein [Acidimicrobiia bacterium]